MTDFENFSLDELIEYCKTNDVSYLNAKKKPYAKSTLIRNIKNRKLINKDMAEIIRMPKMSDTMEEGVIAAWLKKVGDSFEADEPLVEIETDKITVEVPAPSAGSISEIKVEEGADVNIGGVLALLGEKKLKE